jgi:hypothetical protein
MTALEFTLVVWVISALAGLLRQQWCMGAGY